MRILELYSTTHQFGDVARDLGHEVKSVKIEVESRPLIIPNTFDFIWYMPACQYFSIASISHYWYENNQPKLPVAKQALESIQHMEIQFSILSKTKNPPIIFVENPVGKLRKLPVLSTLNRITITQCQYGDDRMKPTDLWTNSTFIGRPKCKNGDSCHVSAPRGSRKGTQGRKTKIDKAKLPTDLIKEILGVK